jgi:hypothetical protein
MLAEIGADIAQNTLYMSDNLSPQGRVEYPQLLHDAGRKGNDATLAAQIASRLNSHEKPRKLPSGAFSKAPIMRSNAHLMLAEGQFNTF